MKDQMVKIVTDGTPLGTRILLADGSDLAAQACSVSLSISPGDITRAEITFGLVPIDYEGEAVFMILHPVSGQKKRVARIEYADGTCWPAIEAGAHEAR